MTLDLLLYIRQWKEKFSEHGQKKALRSEL
jgi:hypothetical protein